MNQALEKISTPLIDSNISIIQRLARSGRSYYQRYLVRPLSGWSTAVPGDPLDAILDMISTAENESPQKLPILYKLALTRSVAPDQLDLSQPGNLSIRFLNAMKEIADVAASEEALEFNGLLKSPLREFAELEFNKMDQTFTAEMNRADDRDVEALVKIREGRQIEIDALQKQSSQLLKRILALLDAGQISNAKREMISYLLKLSQPAAPAVHQELFEMIENPRNHGLIPKKELLESTAIIIYHELMKAIREHQLHRAITLIAKYAIIFRGNPDTPYYTEMDIFEKKFFKLIESRNLWDHI